MLIDTRTVNFVVCEECLGIILTIMFSYKTQNRIILTDTEAETANKLSHVMRKPAFCICRNKGADQLHSILAADEVLSTFVFTAEKHVT